MEGLVGRDREVFALEAFLETVDARLWAQRARADLVRKLTEPV